MNLIGIIQGRLSKAPKNKLQHFPKNYKDEFALAKKANLKYIEFFSERKLNLANPIWTKQGIEEYKKLVKKNDLIINTFCDDFIISNSIKKKNTIDYIISLSKNLYDLKCKKLVLPFYGKNTLSKKNILIMSRYIEQILKILKKKNIKLLIETNLSAVDYFKLKKCLKLKNFKLAFDTGNRVLYNKELAQDIILLGNDIGHVHIKDKNILKTNVKLGTGLVNFKEVFKAFKFIKYKQSFTFETVRNKNPFLTAKNNVRFIKKLLK